VGSELWKWSRLIWLRQGKRDGCTWYFLRGKHGRRCCGVKPDYPPSNNRSTYLLILSGLFIASKAYATVSPPWDVFAGKAMTAMRKLP